MGLGRRSGGPAGWGVVLASVLGAALAHAAPRPQSAAGPAMQSTTQTQAQTQTQSQTPNLAEQTIGRIRMASTAEKIQVSGAVTLNGETALLGNGSTVTAGSETLPIQLTRGGRLELCSTTLVHLSQQYDARNANSPLMVALDHGAIEAHYKLGDNSDVVLTPDLRILLSGPGQADVRIRVNEQGDTCVANRGKDAPYVTVSEQIGTGVYRVQPNQRVMFEHGSVRNVVDNETQPCGCPAPVTSTAAAGVSAPKTLPVAKPGQAVAPTPMPVGGPSSTPADTTFPLAESEGLAPAPKMPATRAAAPGEVESQVTTTLSYVAPQQAVPTGAPNGMATPESAATTATTPAAGFGTQVNSGPVAAAPVTRPPKPAKRPGFFQKIGRFFARIFG